MGSTATMVGASVNHWRDVYESDGHRWLESLRHMPERYSRSLWSAAVVSWTPQRGDAAVDGNLAGVPFLVKDIFDVRGEVTGCSSDVLLDTRRGVNPPPAAGNAWLVEKMMENGALPVGRTAMNEFAYGIDGRNSRTGDCRHPRDSRRITGGSSSGSAWAVAAGVVPCALGTDTGGSIRVPAALCGVYGYRAPHNPSFLSGVFPLAPSMDTVGWFTATAGDMAHLLKTLRNLPEEVSEPRRMAWWLPREDWPPGFPVSWEGDLHAGMKQLIGTLRNAGMREADNSDACIAIVQRMVAEGSRTYHVIGSREAWNTHQSWLDRYRHLYSPVVWSLIDRGRQWTDEGIRDSSDVRVLLREELNALMEHCDALILPVTPVATPRADAADGAFREAVLALNCLASLAGWPALTIPVPVGDTRSGGLQIIAPPHKEEVFLSVLHMVQSGGSSLAGFPL